MWFSLDRLEVCSSCLQCQVGPLVSDRQVNMIVPKCCADFSSFHIFSLIIKSLYLRFKLIISYLATSAPLSSDMLRLLLRVQVTLATL